MIGAIPRPIRAIFIRSVGRGNKYFKTTLNVRTIEPKVTSAMTCNAHKRQYAMPLAHAQQYLHIFKDGRVCADSVA
jgi:hypothetical protein